MPGSIMLVIVVLIGGLGALFLVLQAANHIEDLLVRTIVDLVKYVIDTLIKESKP